MFFIYDHSLLQSEADDLKDALLCFYPSTVPESTQCALCGQLMGMVMFYNSFTGSPPAVITLHKEQFVLKHVDHFSLALSGAESQSESSLVNQLEALFHLFVFYHGSITQVTKTDHSGIWERLVLFSCHYGDILSTVLETLPVHKIGLSKSRSRLFLRSSLLLQYGQEKVALAGCILYKNQVVCSQLPLELTGRLLLLQSEEGYPFDAVKTDFSLPDGVQIVRVHMSSSELASVCPARCTKPFHQHHTTPSQSDKNQDVKESSFVSRTDSFGKTQNTAAETSDTDSSISSPMVSTISSLGETCTNDRSSSLVDVNVVYQINSMQDHDTLSSSTNKVDILESNSLQNASCSSILEDNKRKYTNDQDSDFDLVVTNAEFQDNEPATESLTAGENFLYDTEQLNAENVRNEYQNGTDILERSNTEQPYDSDQTNKVLESQIDQLSSRLQESQHENSDCGYDQGRDVLREGKDLIEAELYIQGHSDLLLVLLMDKGSSQDAQLVHSLWQSMIGPLGELDVPLKDCIEVGVEAMGLVDNYYYLSHDSLQKQLSGNVANPTSSPERAFSDRILKVHDLFLQSDSLTEVTTRTHHGTMYAHRSVAKETYFQLWGSQPLQQGGLLDHMSLDVKAKKKLAKDYDIILF